MQEILTFIASFISFDGETLLELLHHIFDSLTNIQRAMSQYYTLNFTPISSTNCHETQELRAQLVFIQLTK